MFFLALCSTLWPFSIFNHTYRTAPMNKWWKISFFSSIFNTELQLNKRNTRTHVRTHTHIMHPFHILFVRRSLSLFEREKKKKKKLNRIAWERGTSKDNINLIYSLVHCTLHARSTYIVGVCLFSFIFLRKRKRRVCLYTRFGNASRPDKWSWEREREKRIYTPHRVHFVGMWYDK